MKRPLYRFASCLSSHGIGTLFFFLLSVLSCQAGETLTIEPDAQFNFAEDHLEKGRFRQAIDEFQRFIYFFPDDPRSEAARFKIGLSFMGNNQCAEAIEALERLVRESPRGEFFLASHWAIADCYVRLERHDAAVAFLRNLIARTEDPAVEDRANYRIGWIYVDRGSFGTARQYFEKIGSEYRRLLRIDSLFSELEKAPLLERKNPVLAGGLSVVPGLGYLYMGRYRDALVAFLVNGAMIYATYAAVENDNPALGGILAFLELGFYSANIYGSTASAHKYNRAKERGFIEHLKQNLRLRFSSLEPGKDVLLTVRVEF
jgi:tetratricopeptide (TPR) repeat protein